MSELLYKAQQYFPSKCFECPFLIGLIEDGEISPGEVSQDEVIAVIREEAKSHNFETCPGPTIIETKNGPDVTCEAETTY